MYVVVFTTGANRSLLRIPASTARRIREKIRQYAAKPESLSANVKKLTGRDEYRLRVGDWRILFTVEQASVEESIMTVHTIASRGSVY